MRPSASANHQMDGVGSSSNGAAQASGDASRPEDKSKKKGKASKFERLRLTGDACTMCETLSAVSNTS